MTLKDNLVSVVIPAHNAERFISRTLESALAQSYDPLEVVVVDDGSTDQTAILVEEAAARDNRIRLFRTQNSGVAAARNLGISEARGKLIAPLDADDLWHPEKIARQVRVMQTSSPRVGLVYCWSIEIDDNDFIITPLSCLGSESTPQGRVTEELAKSNFLNSGSSPLIKRSCIDAVGGYDPTLRPHGAEDWKLYLALSEICEFAAVPEYLVGYRRWSGSLSRNVTGMARSAQLVASWAFEKWPNLPEEVKRQSIYNLNVHLARLAFDNNQFLVALKYHARAYGARPAALLERSSLEFDVRVLARMAGLTRIVRKRSKDSVPFHKFEATKQVKTSC
jgi:glycosyltransferase involved in cell wall biosynthesis